MKLKEVLDNDGILEEIGYNNFVTNINKQFNPFVYIESVNYPVHKGDYDKFKCRLYVKEVMSVFDNKSIVVSDLKTLRKNVKNVITSIKNKDGKFTYLPIVIKVINNNLTTVKINLMGEITECNNGVPEEYHIGTNYRILTIVKEEYLFYLGDLDKSDLSEDVKIYFLEYLLYRLEKRTDKGYKRGYKILRGFENGCV